MRGYVLAIWRIDSLVDCIKIKQFLSNVFIGGKAKIIRNKGVREWVDKSVSVTESEMKYVEEQRSST